MGDDILDRLGEQEPENEPLRRAHSIVISAGGDTARDLANELYHLANLIDRSELTKGCCGSPTSGSIYSYVRDPGMTHDRYFAEIDKRLNHDLAEAS